jgi:hypothetical protein
MGGSCRQPLDRKPCYMHTSLLLLQHTTLIGTRSFLAPHQPQTKNLFLDSWSYLRYTIIAAQMHAESSEDIQARVKRRARLGGNSRPEGVLVGSIGSSAPFCQRVQASQNHLRRSHNQYVLDVSLSTMSSSNVTLSTAASFGREHRKTKAESRLVRAFITTFPCRVHTTTNTS